MEKLDHHQKGVLLDGSDYWGDVRDLGNCDQSAQYDAEWQLQMVEALGGIRIWYESW
jgi:hypothetical protein